MKLAVAVRHRVGGEGKSGAASVPSALWSSRVKGGRLSINPSHEDFPALLAEAMDVLEADGYDTSATAQTLAVSTSQLVKLLRHEPAALQHVNTQRVERGLGALR